MDNVQATKHQVRGQSQRHGNRPAVREGERQDREHELLQGSRTNKRRRPNDTAPRGGPGIPVNGLRSSSDFARAMDLNNRETTRHQTQSQETSQIGSNLGQQEQRPSSLLASNRSTSGVASDATTEHTRTVQRQGDALLGLHGYSGHERGIAPSYLQRQALLEDADFSLTRGTTAEGLLLLRPPSQHESAISRGALNIRPLASDISSSILTSQPFENQRELLLRLSGRQQQLNAASRGGVDAGAERDALARRLVLQDAQSLQSLSLPGGNNEIDATAALSSTNRTRAALETSNLQNQILMMRRALQDQQQMELVARSHYRTSNNPPTRPPSYTAATAASTTNALHNYALLLGLPSSSVETAGLGLLAGEGATRSTNHANLNKLLEGSTMISHINSLERAASSNLAGSPSVVDAVGRAQHVAALRQSQRALLSGDGLRGITGISSDFLPSTVVGGGTNTLGGATSIYGRRGPDGFPIDLPTLLALPEDVAKLSTHQVFLRHQIQAFRATEDDISTHTRGRNKPIELGQVGIRCLHCCHLSVDRRQKGSTYFPATVLGIYQAAQNMCTTHLQCGLCSEMPEVVKQEFSRLLSTKATSSGAGRPYWAGAAKALGLVDTESNGIRFVRDILRPSSTSNSGSVGGTAHQKGRSDVARRGDSLA